MEISSTIFISFKENVSVFVITVHSYSIPEDLVIITDEFVT